MKSNEATHETMHEGIQSSPDAPFLKEVLGALIFLAAASGTVVFLLL
jgi:hypothetical protein